MIAPANLLSLANSEFRGDVVDRLAGAIGEDPSVTQAALGGTIPALIMGLVEKASTNQGAADLFHLLQLLQLDGTNPANASSALSETEGVSHLMEKGGPLVILLLGGKVGTITQWVSAQTGIRTGSAATLLSLAAPIVLGLVGRQVRSSADATWSVSGLRHLVNDQNITAPRAPAGLASVIGRDREPALAAVHPTMEHHDAWTRWRWVVPLLLLSAGLMAVLSRRPTGIPVLTGASGTKLIKPSELATPVAILPNGVRLMVTENGTESRLIDYLADSNASIDARAWFNLGQVDFEPVSATLTAGSAEQLRNLAAILAAYPRVNLTIGGFTDNVGSPAENKALSAQRALSVNKALVEMGVAPARISTKGFGEERPVSDNATEAGRERNQRIAINVTRK